MESEKLVNKSTSYSVSVTGSKVDSLRLTEKEETVLRVFDGGFIGIAGKKGKADSGDLLKEARSSLENKIPYPETLEENGRREENLSKVIIPPEKFVAAMKSLLSRLSAEYPDFIFSNKIYIDNDFSSYENSKGTIYTHFSSLLDISLVIKDKASANIMDAFYGAWIREYDEDAVAADVGKILSAYSNKIDMPKEDLPVIIDLNSTSYMLRHILADMYMQGASLFNGRLGQKIFNDKFSVCVDHSAGNRRGVPFFDDEGTTLKGDKFYFFKNGVLSGLVTNRRSAEKYKLPLSGCGYSDFTSVPSFALRGYTMDETAPSLNALTGGRAVYVCETSGGDMTADGTLGLPVQLAFLYENGRLVGRLPEFSINGSIFDVFGGDFKGVAKADFLSGDNDKLIVTKFKIN